MPTRVERYEPDGVDYGWVMQVTFVLTIAIGAPLIALLSLAVELPTWGDRASFAVGTGAAVWLATALITYAYERRRVE